LKQKCEGQGKDLFRAVSLIGAAAQPAVKTHAGSIVAKPRAIAAGAIVATS